MLLCVIGDRVVLVVVVCAGLLGNLFFVLLLEHDDEIGANRSIHACALRSGTCKMRARNNALQINVRISAL